LTRFLSTGVSLVNADRIDRIEVGEQHGERWGSSATLRDGTSLPLIDDIDEIEKALLPVVAAAPGFTFLRYYIDWDESGPGIERMPIVAWRIDGATALPVIPDDASTEGNCIGSGVLLPDGQVVRLYVQTFANETAWRAAMDAEAARRTPKAAE
jgi:hypothetical protein